MRLIQSTFAAAIGATFALGMAGPAAAQGANAWVTTDLNLRSGPDTAYPPVMVLPAGAPVMVYGCLDGWSWCDVSWGPNRGWVAGLYLSAMYQDQRIPFAQYAPRRNIPIITFSFGNYWDSYYRGRSWYSERNRWSGWDYGQRRWRNGDAYRKYDDNKPKYDDKRRNDDKPSYDDKSRYDDKDRRRGRFDDKKNDKPPARYDDKKNDKPPARFDRKDDKKNDKPKDDKPKADKKDDKKDDKK